MHTVTLDGREYRLRCDINAYEEIIGRYGTMTEAVKQSEDEMKNLERIKFLLAVMINEQHYYDGTPERVTEKEIAARMMPGDYTKALTAVISCANEAFAPKNV